MGLTIITGEPDVLFGIPDETCLMLDAIPPNSRIRYRLRNRDWARAFVKTPDAIHEYILVQRTPEYWGMDYEQGRNQRS